MPTPAQIDEQIALERDAIKCGVDKLLKNTEALIDREYASATVFGCASIQQAQSIVADEILRQFEYAIVRGKNGVAYADIHKHLRQFNDPEQAHMLANIALKRTFDTVFAPKKKESNKYPNSVPNVCTSIGQAVEHECQIRWYEQTDPDLLKKVQKKYWLNTTGTQQKRTIAQLMFNREEYKWDAWSAVTRARLGGWLLSIVCDVTGWFDGDLVRMGKKTHKLIVPTDTYLSMQEQLMNEAVLYAPLKLPMLVEPNDWTNDRQGGYLLNEVMAGDQLVRKGDPTLIQPDTVLRFINKLQKVAYRLNPFTLGVARQLDEMGYQLGKFKPLSAAANWVMPTKPPNIAEDAEARQHYKRQATEAENSRKNYMRSLHVRTTITLETASRFEGRDFYLPWSFDYRGRAYPIPPFLSVQDTDFGKSLIRFADESFVDEDAVGWIKFQIATTYGLDKKPMLERIAWVEENEDMIRKIAEDPLANLCLWENADEPWQFLAACREYYECCLVCTKHHTSLCIAVDATCSGMQILAGLARDANTARLVNVLPSDSPQDAYRTVAEAMIPKLTEDVQHLAEHITRSTTKRSVMTIPYNATLQSSTQYILDELREKGVAVTWHEGYALAKILRKAMDDVAPGPLKVMDWIKEEMGNAIARGNGVIRWTTPSGFVVNQRRDKIKTKRLDLKLLGRCNFHVLDGVDGPDKRKHQASGAPNLIHSLDASLLHLAFQRFDAPFSVIHDSVLCRATDMGVLSTLVRQTYMYLFAENDYLTDFAQQIGAETEPKIIGDLQPESVIDSTYFFC